MFRSESSVLVVCMLVFLVSSVCPLKAETTNTAAEELLSVVPDGVIGFVATSGSDELKNDFEKSILGRLWYEPGVQDFYK